MPNKPPRPCWYPGCATLNCQVHVRPARSFPDLRPSAARRGYGARWRLIRAAFLAAHPTCEDCGRPSTIPDHVPSRRTLVQAGVPDPDAEQYLHARCHACHNRKTNKQDGGWHPPPGD